MNLQRPKTRHKGDSGDVMARAKKYIKGPAISPIVPQQPRRTEDVIKNVTGYGAEDEDDELRMRASLNSTMDRSPQKGSFVGVDQFSFMEMEGNAYAASDSDEEEEVPVESEPPKTPPSIRIESRGIAVVPRLPEYRPPSPKEEEEIIEDVPESPVEEETKPTVNPLRWTAAYNDLESSGMIAEEVNDGDTEELESIAEEYDEHESLYEFEEDVESVPDTPVPEKLTIRGLDTTLEQSREYDDDFETPSPKIPNSTDARLAQSDSLPALEAPSLRRPPSTPEGVQQRVKSEKPPVHGDDNQRYPPWGNAPQYWPPPWSGYPHPSPYYAPTPQQYPPQSYYQPSPYPPTPYPPPSHPPSSPLSQMKPSEPEPSDKRGNAIISLLEEQLKSLSESLLMSRARVQQYGVDAPEKEPYNYTTLRETKAYITRKVKKKHRSDRKQKR